MNQDKLPFWALPMLVVALVLAAICNWIVWTHWDPTLVMNDGVGYLSTASNWLKGNGFSTNALIFLPHFGGDMPAPEIVWPIGYPAVIAFASVFGLSLHGTALAVNLVTHLLSALLVYLILRRCDASKAIALTGAVVFYFSTEPWILAVAILSEPVFTLLVLGSIAALPANLNFSIKRLLLCALLLAAATTIRYSAAITAVAFATGMGMLCLWQLPRFGAAKFFARVAKLTVFVVVSLLGYAGLQLRVYNISQSLDRDTGTGEINSVADTIRLFAEQTSVLTGFRDGAIFSGDIDKWLFFVFAGIALAIVLLALFASAGKRTHSANKVHSATSKSHYPAIVISVVIAHTVFYAGYLFYCRISESPLPVSARYLYQLQPGLLILFCLIVNHAISSLRKAGRSTILMQSLITVLLALYTVAQLNFISVTEEFTRRGTDAADVLNLEVSNEQSVADMVDLCIGESSDRAIWSNEGVMLHGSTGANTITYTGIYANRPFDFTGLQQQIHDYGITMFMFINNETRLTDRYRQKLLSVEQWLLANNYTPVPLINYAVESGSTFRLYIDEKACNTGS